MADGTRLKEIAADNQRCLSEVRQLTLQVAQMLEMQQATNQRIDQMQSALETRNQNPNAQDDTLQGTSQNSNPLNGSNNRALLQVRGLKLDFPRFDGTNVLHWIFQSE